MRSLTRWTGPLHRLWTKGMSQTLGWAPGQGCCSTVTVTRVLGRNPGGLVVRARVLSISTWGLPDVSHLRTHPTRPQRTAEILREWTSLERRPRPAKTTASLHSSPKALRLSVSQVILFSLAPCEPALSTCIWSHRAHSAGSNSALFVSWEIPEHHPPD